MNLLVWQLSAVNYNQYIPSGTRFPVDDTTCRL